MATTINIGFAQVELEILCDRYKLRREGLVDFHQVHLIADVRRLS
jgi:hypothetical protein